MNNFWQYKLEQKKNANTIIWLRSFQDLLYRPNSFQKVIKEHNNSLSDFQTMTLKSIEVKDESFE